MSSDAARILSDLAAILEPLRTTDPVLERVHGEVMWLRQELEAGALPLPLESTADVYFPYALAEGLVEQWPHVQKRLEALYDVMFES